MGAQFKASVFSVLVVDLGVVRQQNNGKSCLYLQQIPIILDHRSSMSSPNADYDENQQSIEFYKIKLMEKEREISQNAAKLKKIEFKNNRDIKELKMAEEKLKVQLKEEKQKLDKSTKSLIETTEQNNVLQFRINELKEEKDKEIESTRAQYNFLKNEVRSYERILPTHTFMSKLGATYEQLPTYEEVFMNWKDKSERLSEIQDKMKKLKAESEEKLEMQQKVNEGLQKKKLQLEKQLRDDIAKLLDLESQVTTLVIERDDLHTKYGDLISDLSTTSQNLELQTEYGKQMELKIEELSRVYQSELHNKEEEIQKVTEEEFRKYEDEIQRITRAFEMKENSHLQQLAYFEEEEQKLLDKLQKDKEKFEETYKQIYAEVEKIKRELDIEKEERWKEKTDYDKIKIELNRKTNEYLECMRKLGEDEFKIEELTNEFKKLQDKMSVSNSDANSKHGELMAEKSELELRIKELIEQISELKDEIILKDNQIRGLHIEIDELKSKGLSGSNFKVNSLSFSGMDLDRDSIRERSNTEENNEFQKVGSLQEVTVVTSAIRNRQQSIVSQESYVQRRKTSASYYTQSQFDAKLAEGLKELELEIESRYHIKIEEAKLLAQQQLKENLHKEVLIVTAQHRKQLNQSRRREEDAQSKLKKLQDEHEAHKLEFSESVAKWTKKYDLLKTDKQGIEQNNLNQMLESKKEKQNISSIKNQNRELEKTLKDYQRLMEAQNVQLEALRKYKENGQAKESKEKSVSSESSTTNIKEIIEKYTSQITKIMQEKEEVIKSYDQAEKIAAELRKEMEGLHKEMEGLRLENQQKVKQNEMLLDLLDHERKDRTLRTVPSLAALPDQDVQEQENFKQFYNQAGQKEGQITLLQRELADLKSEMEDEKKKYEREMASLEEQMKGYIEEIITMKLKVANAEMKASEKTHLYNQLKKKLNIA